MRLSSVRLFVCLSVCPSHHSSAAHYFGGFAAIFSTEPRDWLEKTSQKWPILYPMWEVKP